MHMKNILLLASLAFILAIAACGESPKDAKSQSSNTEAAAPAPETVVYACPMKCEGEKTYTAAGQCPVCGMDLEKVAEASGAEQPEGHSDHDGHQH